MPCVCSLAAVRAGSAVTLAILDAISTSASRGLVLIILHSRDRHGRVCVAEPPKPLPIASLTVLPCFYLWQTTETRRPTLGNGRPTENNRQRYRFGRLQPSPVMTIVDHRMDRFRGMFRR
jgi:hypothetical protein